MRRILVTLAATALAVPMMAGAASADPDSAANVNENANCLGAERAERNSAGGDREKGAFGKAQSAYVADLNAQGTSFGAFLQGWKAGC